MVSERDKRIMELVGKALNPPIQKVTKEEKLKNFNFGEYLEFLFQGKAMMISAKGKLSDNPASAAEVIHKRALELNLIKYNL